jgi:hypothetical protein
MAISKAWQSEMEFLAKTKIGQIRRIPNRILYCLLRSSHCHQQILCLEEKSFIKVKSVTWLGELLTRT